MYMYFVSYYFCNVFANLPTYNIPETHLVYLIPLPDNNES